MHNQKRPGLKARFGEWHLVCLRSGRWAAVPSTLQGVPEAFKAVLEEDNSWFASQRTFDYPASFPSQLDALTRIVQNLEESASDEKLSSVAKAKRAIQKYTKELVEGKKGRPRDPKLTFGVKTMGDYQKKIAGSRAKKHTRTVNKNTSPVTVTKLDADGAQLSSEVIAPVFDVGIKKKKRSRLTVADKSLL